MPKTLEAHDRLICEIFNGDYQFEIPDYQRPYVWKTDQVDELFSDLITATRDFNSSKEVSQYFLGSIVLIKKDRDPKAFVVDGQQRLTTLTILLAVLRELMPIAAEDIQGFIYKRGKSTLGEKDEYHFTARQEDVEFFRKYIQEQNGIQKLITSKDRLQDSRLRYQENTKYLRKKIETLSIDERNEFWKFIARECSLVVISTPDFDAAYRIFSVLNDRGLDLTPVDILKAEILSNIRQKFDEKEYTKYAKKWSDLETQLGRDAFNELFPHICSVYGKQKAKEAIVKKFRESVPEYKNKPNELIDTVIQPYAEIWGFICDEDFEAVEDTETINDYLLWLNLVDFKDWVPPALAYFKRSRQQLQQLIGFLSSLERLTYFLLVTKATRGERIEIYTQLIEEIKEGKSTAFKTFELTDKQKEEFVTALDGNIYERLSKAGKALILRLESLMSDGSKKLTFNYVSLEHVLPQTISPSSEWAQWFPNVDERGAWVHRLANLVPLHQKTNTAARNASFKEKKNKYFFSKKSSPFILVQDLREEQEWTPQVLSKRQERLINLFKQHWQL